MFRGKGTSYCFKTMMRVAASRYKLYSAQARFFGNAIHVAEISFLWHKLNVLHAPHVVSDRLTCLSRLILML